jgi:hypothetical protein
VSLGRLGPSLGRLWLTLGALWAALGRLLGCPGGLWAVLGAESEKGSKKPNFLDPIWLQFGVFLEGLEGLRTTFRDKMTKKASRAGT